MYSKEECRIILGRAAGGGGGGGGGGGERLTDT